MGQLNYEGRIAELNVSSVTEDELEGIRDGDFESDEIRDEMNNIHMCYNVIMDEGKFLDENDDEVEINYSTIYCSNIGEPLLRCSQWGFDMVIEMVSDAYGEDGFDAVYDTLKGNGQFDEDLNVIDEDIIEKLNRFFTVYGSSEDEDDEEFIENVASVISTEKGDLSIEIPDSFDMSKPITIGTHEVEMNGYQIGVFIMQFNNGKLLFEQIDPELDSSTTKGTDIYYMANVEDDDGRMLSDDFDEV